VTGLKSNGFFLQTPETSRPRERADLRGIFVFKTAPPAGAAVVTTSHQQDGREFKPDPGSLR
jgi:hypothetical protein